MKPPLRIGILDFGLRTGNLNSLLKMQDVLEYAGQADELGFSRFWIAEHYFSNLRTAWTNPVPVIPLLATVTSRIRIGTAGILLKLHNPFHVAGTFKLYNNLFGNRVDLGLVNGGSYNERIAAYCRAGGVSFEESFRELLHYLRDEPEVYEAGEGALLPPYGGSLPEVWAMSTSNHGFGRALELGTHFSRSIFHAGADLAPCRKAVRAFREAFFRRHGALPQVNLAVSVCCQASAQKARQVFESQELDPKLCIVGNAAEVHEALVRLGESFGVDEIICKDVAKERQDRFETLELLSKSFGLTHRPAKTPASQAA
jgi:alkanesulfonate monooxygenase SsuD/methylene tetrahydromethanopterin reductase-like flavin-dependent oxidoreductase (luciferase family)